MAFLYSSSWDACIYLKFFTDFSNSSFAAFLNWSIIPSYFSLILFISSLLLCTILWIYGSKFLSVLLSISSILDFSHWFFFTFYSYAHFSLLFFRSSSYFYLIFRLFSSNFFFFSINFSFLSFCYSFYLSNCSTCSTFLVILSSYILIF